MRFRITVRGQGVELRGFIDGDLEDVNSFAENSRPWLVVASPAADDYDPFKEAERRELHHFETEEENARLEADNMRLASNLDREKREHESTLHIGQDYLRTLDKVREARSNHPEIPDCDKHPEGGVVTCGWKRAVIDMDEALA